MKKYCKWIFTAAMLLMVLLAMAGCSEEASEPETQQQRVLVAWNVDRDLYYDAENKMSLRGKVGENYRVRFAVDGEQIDLFVPGATMMDYVDSMKFMGLAVDENNVVTQVYKPHEFTGGLAAYEYYVISIDGEKMMCNNTSNGKGLPLKLKINENTQVFDVAGGGPLAGRPGVLSVGARIYAINGLDGYVSHIYVTPPFQMKDVYWNVNRQYNNASKSSTRQRDALGYFNIEFVLNGQLVTHRTQSIEVIDKIDGFAARCMMLEFDENGLISDAIHARYATGGATVASWYHVLRLDKAGQTDNIDIVSDGFYAEKFSGSDKGSTVQATFAENCKILNMSGTGAYLGEETDLRVGDQIHCLSNSDGDVCLIFIITRPRQIDLYYNMERKWNNDAKVSTRVQSSDGYYYFKMSVNGKAVTLKTQDPEIVKTIDSRAARVLGLELDGKVITGAYNPIGVAGANKTVFDYTDVTAIEGNEITATRNGQIYSGVMAEDCKVWNVSTTATTKGEATKVREGDKVYALGDTNGEIHNIYVVGRTINSPVYWNLDRSYDSATKTTKRVPAEDGFYYIKLSNGTQTKTFKTKSKSLVNKLDSFVAVALTTSGDTITGVYKYDCAKGYTGGGFASWAIVKSVKGSTVVASDSKKTYTGTMAYGCQVYMVAGGSAVPVTKTTVQVGDRIHGIKNASGQIVQLYIVSRPVYADLYYNVERLWNDEAKTTLRVADEEGWYWLTMAVNGEHVQLKTQNVSFVNTIDERAARVLGLQVKDNEILAVYKPGDVEGSKSTVFDYTTVTAITEDGVISAVRNDKTYVGTLSEDAKIFNVSKTAEQLGEVTTVQVGDVIYGLGNNSKAVNYIFVTGRTPKLETKTAVCSVCQQEVTWTAWDGKTKLADGHWYLTKGVQVDTAVNILQDTTVCLDLCGMEVNGAETLDRILNIYGTLNIMDSGETGKIIANFSNETGRTGSVFYVQNSKNNGYGTLNLYSGTLTSTGRTKQGGIGGVSNVFNMYGGTITGGSASKGGNLFLEYNADVKVGLYGGVIGDGNAELGGCIYARSGLTVGGDVQIADVYLESGVTIAIDALAETASIGVTLQDTYGVIATGAAEADLSRFLVADGLQKVFADGQLVIPVPETSHTDHCICGGLGAVGDHTCLTEMPVWEPWTGSWESGKYYYLTDDFQVNSTIQIEEGQTLHLCLNGKDMIGAANVNRIFNIFGVLDICDHKNAEGVYAGEVICNYDPAGGNIKTGGVFYVQNRTNAALNLFGGNLKLTTKLKNGGVGGITAKFNLYDGTLTGTTVSGDGGVLYLEHANAKVNLYGGTVTGGRATNGGNIYIKNGTVTIDGGSVLGGYASNAGGSIRVQADATLKLISGSITGGEAKGNGGNIYSLGNIVITGGNVTDGMVVSGKIGGNLYASGGTLSITNATVTGGSATTGGNIAIKVDGAAITSSTISGGTADTGADIYFEKAGGTLTVTDCGEVEVHCQAGTVEQT